MSADDERNDDYSGDDDFDDDDFDDFEDEEESGSSKKRVLTIAAVICFLGVIVYFITSTPAPVPLEPEFPEEFTPPLAAPEPIPATEPVQTDTIPEIPEKPAQKISSIYDPSNKTVIADEKKPEPLEKSPPERDEKAGQTTLSALLDEKEKPRPMDIPAVKKAGKFTIQVGTYVLEESFNRAKAVLRKMDMSAVKSMGRIFLTYYNVLVGEFQDVEEMKNIVKVLSNDGIPVKVQISKTETYTLSALSGFNKKKAYSKKKELILKGYPARVTEERKKRVVYILKTGRYSSRKEAARAIPGLKKRGLGAMIVPLGRRK